VWNLPDGINFEAGKEYIYSISFTGTSGNVSVTGDINPWEPDVPYIKLSTAGYTYQYSDREIQGSAGSDWPEMLKLLDGNYTTYWTSYMTANFNWWKQDQISFTIPSQIIDRVKIYRPAGNTDPMTVKVQFAHAPYEALRYGFAGNEATFQPFVNVVTIDVPEGTKDLSPVTGYTDQFVLLFLTVSRPENGPMRLSEIECYQKK
jgi:hypothetical protein